MVAGALVLGLSACGPRDLPASPPAHAASAGAVEVPSQGFEADLAASQAFVDTRPRVERPVRVTGLETIEGIASMSAETCAACHVEIAREWRSSVHAQAWIDPQYQAEIGKSDNRWLCVNCHTPLTTQQEWLPVGLVDGDVERPRWVANARFDAALRDEGLNCAGCHVREDGIHGPGLENSEAPHPVVVDERYQPGGDDPMCLDCHQAEMRYEDKPFVCTFQTGDEWRSGPYDDEGKNCIDCHQPRVRRAAAVGGPLREVGSHYFKGSGIPKFADRGWPPGTPPPPGLEVIASLTADGLEITATNANAGHWLPSGDPERWVQVEATFLDAAGAELTSEVTRFGQTWQWTTPPVKLADNRLKPRESRTWTLPLPAGAVSADVVASSHRISKENAAYHNLGDYPRSVETFRRRVDLVSQNGTN